MGGIRCLKLLPSLLHTYSTYLPTVVLLLHDLGRRRRSRREEEETREGPPEKWLHGLPHGGCQDFSPSSSSLPPSSSHAALLYFKLHLFPTGSCLYVVNAEFVGEEKCMGEH